MTSLLDLADRLETIHNDLFEKEQGRTPSPAFRFDPTPQSEPYLPYIQQAEEKYGLPKNLLARVIQQESDFNPEAVSSKGARGIAQIMPDYHPDVDPDDPIQAIDYAAGYLRQNADRFGGDWDKAIAAYNAGPANVEKGIMPAETQDYLARIKGGNAPPVDYLALADRLETIHKQIGAPEPGYIKTAAKGMARGAESILGGVGSAIRWLGDVTHYEALARLGEESANYWRQAVQEGWEAPDPRIFRGSFIENPSLKRAIGIVGEALPSLGAALGISFAAGPAAGAGFLGLIEGAPQYEEARAAGKGVAEASTYGLISTAGTALLEFVPLGRMLARGKGGSKLVHGLMGGFEEGLQETTQTVFQNLVAKIGYDDTRNLFEGIIESMIGGFGSGTIAGGTVSKLNDVLERHQNHLTEDDIDAAHAVTEENVRAGADAVRNAPPNDQPVEQDIARHEASKTVDPMGDDSIAKDIIDKIAAGGRAAPVATVPRGVGAESLKAAIEGGEIAPATFLDPRANELLHVAESGGRFGIYKSGAPETQKGNRVRGTDWFPSREAAETALAEYAGQRNFKPLTTEQFTQRNAQLAEQKAAAEKAIPDELQAVGAQAWNYINSEQFDQAIEDGSITAATGIAKEDIRAMIAEHSKGKDNFKGSAGLYRAATGVGQLYDLTDERLEELADQIPAGLMGQIKELRARRPAQPVSTQVEKPSTEVEAPAITPAIAPETKPLTKRQKAEAEYNELIAGLTDQQRQALGDLIPETPPKNFALQAHRIRKQLAEMEKVPAKPEIPTQIMRGGAGPYDVKMVDEPERPALYDELAALKAKADIHGEKFPRGTMMAIDAQMRNLENGSGTLDVFRAIVDEAKEELGKLEKAVPSAWSREQWERVPGGAYRSTYGNYLISGEEGAFRLTDESTGRQIGGTYTDRDTAAAKANEDYIRQKGGAPEVPAGLHANQLAVADLRNLTSTKKGILASYGIKLYDDAASAKAAIEAIGPRGAEETIGQYLKKLRNYQKQTPPPIAPEKKVRPYDQVAEFVRGRLKTDTTIGAPQLVKAAQEAFGGKMAAGTFSIKQTYDAMELGVNQHILKNVDLTKVTPQQAIDRLKSIIGKLPTQTKRTAETDEYQQFSTPPPLAYVANWAANIQKGDQYLEPSAGVGGLAIFGKKMGAGPIVVNEIGEFRKQLLMSLPFDTYIAEDGAQLGNMRNAPHMKNIQPDVVVMNPPFSATAGRIPGRRSTMEGAAHVEQALKILKDGGRLVAITGKGMAMDRPAFTDWWKKIKAKYNVRANVGVSGQEYRKYGTTFGNQLIVIDKTGPTTDDIVIGNVEKTEDLIPILEEVRNARAAKSQPVAGQPAGQEAPEPTRPGLRPEIPVRPTAGGVGLGGEQAGAVGPRGGPAGGGRPPVSGRPGEAGQLLGGRARPERPAARPAEPGGGRGAVLGALAGETERGGERVELTATEKKRATKELSDNLYEGYRPERLKIKGAKAHPTALVQSAAMSAVTPPKPTYKPNLPQATIVGNDKGQGLSDIQIESVVYAGQAHEQMLPDGETRMGYFIGDGTGVGKGREIAGILMDNWSKGRKKHIWISEKVSLLNDAKRDVENVLWDPALVFAQNKTKSGAPIKTGQGIVFTTYDTLKSKSKDKVPKRRIDQLIDWVGKDFDGVIAFDESHNMGNAVAVRQARGTKKPSKKALVGMELQQRLPKARVVYVSATGATEVINLAYAQRLGLWGEGMPFATNATFVNQISSGGIAAMEMVAQDLKAMGKYNARSLSYDGVEYSRVEHALNDDQVQQYDKMAEAWQTVLNNIKEALEIIGATKGQTKTNTMSIFWGAHQRFFNQVITAMQLPSVIKAIKQDLAEDKSVVIQLVNTLEAAQERQLAQAYKTEDLESLDLSPFDMLMQMVTNSFPVVQQQEVEDENGNIKIEPVIDSQGNFVENADAVEIRERLLDELGALRGEVAGNPLDDIIEIFGVNNVAEITGRKRRVITAQTPEGPKKVIDKRSKKKTEADADQFMAGKKRVLVFSEAGGTGRSYHADRNVQNQQQRVHYLLQAGWRADKAVQGMGRSHRSNQAIPPIFRLVTTDLKGQKRFISSIARRLDQLGALTKGSRKTGSQGIFSAKDNLESDHAKDALELLFADLYAGDIEDLTIEELQRQTGLRLVDDNGNRLAFQVPITQFLNRLLSMNVTMQNKVFDHLSERIDAVFNSRLQQGTLDVGLETLKAKGIQKTAEQTVYTDPSGAETKYIQLDVTQPARRQSWDEVAAREQFVQNVKSGVVWAVQKQKGINPETGNRETSYYLTNPRKSRQAFSEAKAKQMLEENKWAQLTKEQAQGLWQAQYDQLPAEITYKEHIISGLLLPIWDRLIGHPRIWRIQTNEGEQMIGRRIDEEHLAQTLENLGAGEVSIDMTPEQVHTNVLENNYTVRLANGWELKRVRVSDEQRIEIKNIGWSDYQLLQQYGLFSERINWQTRIFVPTDPETGAQALKRVMLNRPIVKASPPISARYQGISGDQVSDVASGYGEPSALQTENVDVPLYRQLPLFGYEQHEAISPQKADKLDFKETSKVSEPGRVQVTLRRTGYIRAQGRSVRGVGDAAALLSHLTDDPQENIYFITVDDTGTVLEVHKYSRGTKAASFFNPVEAIGHLLAQPEAAHVYFIHNHPSNIVSGAYGQRPLEPSKDDRWVAATLRAYLNLSDIGLTSLLMGGNEFMQFKEGAFEDSEPLAVPETVKQVRVTVRERRQKPKVSPATAQLINQPWLAVQALKQYGPVDGVMFLNFQNINVGFMAWPKGLTHQKAAAEIITRASQLNAAGVIFNFTGRDWMRPGHSRYEFVAHFKTGLAPMLNLLDIVAGGRSLYTEGQGQIVESTHRPLQALQNLKSEQTLLAMGTGVEGRAIDAGQVRNVQRAVDVVTAALASAGVSKELRRQIALELKPIIDLRGRDVEQTIADWVAQGKTMSTILGATTFNRFTALMELSLEQDLTSMERTSYHEALHVLARWVLPEAEYGRLMKFYKGNEEAAADGFADYMAGRSKPVGWLRRIFIQLRNLLQRVGNALRGAGFVSAEDIFGRLAGRAYAPRRAAAAAGTNIALMAEQRAQRWYSQMERHLEAKLPGRGTPAQIKQLLNSWAKKGQINAEELEWSGLPEWLDEQTGKIDKEAVLAQLAAGRVRLDEVLKEEGLEPTGEKIFPEGMEAPEFDSEGIFVEPDQQYIEEQARYQREEFGIDEEVRQEFIDRYGEEDVNDGQWDNEIDEEARNRAEQNAWEDAYEFGEYAYASNNGWDYSIYTMPLDKIFNLHGPDGFIDQYDSFDAAKEAAEEHALEQFGVDEMEDFGETEFAKWQLPGGKQYRELLLTLPERVSPERIAHDSFIQRMQEKYLTPQWRQKLTAEEEAERARLAEQARLADAETGTYKTTHWAESNVLVHVRFNERVGPDGERILFVEEIQSDWHQTGRKEGYAGRKRARSQIEEAMAAAFERQYKPSGVPDAPFKKTWPLLAIKRMVRFAAENGFDTLAWTPGEIQAARYDLSKQVDRIASTRKPNGTYRIEVFQKATTNAIIDHNYPENELEDVVGKELAEKIIGSPNGLQSWRGLDLKVGGEGMKGFYDEILPAAANRFFGKKAWGKAKVKKTVVPKTEFSPGEKMEAESPYTIEAWSLPVTPEMRAKALGEGMTLFQVKEGTTDVFGEVLPAEVSEQMKAARGRERASVKERFTDWLKMAIATFTPGQMFPQMPNKFFGKENEILRRFVEISSYSKARAVMDLKEILNPKQLGPAGYDLFNLKIVLDDMLYDVETEGRPLNDWQKRYGELPFGFKNADQLRESIARIDQRVTANLDVQAALKKRRQVMRDLRKDLVAKHLLPKSVLADERYFHHEVLQFANMAHMAGTGTGSRDVRTKKKGWQIYRTGSLKAYNTEYMQSEFKVLAQGYAQLETQRIIDELDASSNIIKELRADAKATNKENFYKLAAKFYSKQFGTKITPTEVRNDHKLDPLFEFRRNIAMGFADLAKMAHEDRLMVPPEFDRVVDELADQYMAKKLDEMEDMPAMWTPRGSEQGAIWALLNHLVNTGGPGSAKAAMIFKAITGRNQAIEKVLSDNFLTWEKLMQERDPREGSTGWVEWIPKPGSAWYLTNSLTDKLLEQYAAGIPIPQEEIRKVWTRGTDKRWVVPTELAEVLNGREFLNLKQDNVVAAAAEKSLNWWKRWILINPFRIFKYNFNNLSGDFDITLAYDPKILKWTKDAAKNLWALHYDKPLHPATKAELTRALKHGVIGSGMTVHDIPDITDTAQFDQLVSALRADKRKSIDYIKRFWEGSKNFTTWRENVLRLAAYRYFQSQIRAGKRVYGASDVTKVDAVIDPDKKAALLARELIGDYGGLSKGGQWLRRKAIPFYSWMEINTPRYWRMFKNLPVEGEPRGRRLRMGGALAKKAGVTTVKMALFYGMVQAFNHLVWPDEEEELGEVGRRQLHMILGRRPDGSIMSVRMQGALSDALSWLGAEDIPQDLADVRSGKKRWWQLLAEAPVSITNRLVQGIRPDVKGPAELIAGRQVFPDVTKPRPIRDRVEHLSRMFSLEPIYRHLAGKPIRGNTFAERIIEDLASTVIATHDPGQVAFYQAKTLAIDYLEKQGIERPMKDPSNRSNALYYYRKAIQLGDIDKAARYLKKYIALGGSLKGLKVSVKRQHPLGGLPAAHRLRFMASLTPADKETVKRAIAWYRKTYR